MKRLIKFLKLFCSGFWDSMPFDTDTKVFFLGSLLGASIGVVVGLIQRRPWDWVGGYALAGVLGIWLGTMALGCVGLILCGLATVIIGAFESARDAWRESK